MVAVQQSLSGDHASMITLWQYSSVPVAHPMPHLLLQFTAWPYSQLYRTTEEMMHHFMELNSSICEAGGGGRRTSYLDVAASAPI